MPENQDEKAIDILSKDVDLNKDHFLEIGQKIEIFIEDISIYSGKITKDNINKIEKCILSGCKHGIK